ncbi:MAG TPA: Rrf2 family transcriptional regulator [Candidatus Binatia bacterium]|nr:Rrf2 family transcriptional regulator [Candidatus Binatia bacterium]
MPSDLGRPVPPGTRSSSGSGLRVSLTLRGDYAVRTMLALGRAPEGGLVSASRIAAMMDIPIRFVAHVLTDLRRAGLVVGQTGRTGGYRLAKPASEIDLLQIVDATQEQSEPPRCVLRGGPCDVHGRCDVHDAFSAATLALRAELARTTLEALARRR